MSTQDVSWQNPFGTQSTAAQITGPFGTPAPNKAMQAGQVVLKSNNIDTNPIHTSLGTSANNYIKGQSGGQIDLDPSNSPQSYESISKPATAMSPGGYSSQPTPTNSVAGGMAGTQGARALEESLRSSKRQSLNPNVEYGFNLQSNPIASSTVRKGV